jgi:predicted dehydrogenase
MNTQGKIRVGLYGTEGHQIHAALENHPHAELAAVAAFKPEACPPWFARQGVKVLGSLDELLAEPDIQLVSFCSPFKDEQGEHIIRCLQAGKHAYAEKPCCMDEPTLDRILETARRTGRRFHEMAGTAWEEPYATIRETIASGAIGEVIQIHAQKSYPWTAWRPADERVDGGLSLQVGVYATRFAEHVAGLKISSIALRETKLGNDKPGSECRRAASFLMEFTNGGVGGGVANYCCPASPSWPKWGYESLIVFGSRGFVECLDGGRIGQLIVEGQPPVSLDFTTPRTPFFDLFLEEIRSGKDLIPMSPEAETSPTRWVIRAKNQFHNQPA